VIVCSGVRQWIKRGWASKVSKVNRDICKAPLNTIAFSKALRYGNTQCYLQTSHICLYSPAADHHRPLAGTHFTVPRRVEGWVDPRGWLHTEIKCRLRKSNPKTYKIIFYLHDLDVDTFSHLTDLIVRVVTYELFPVYTRVDVCKHFSVIEF